MARNFEDWLLAYCDYASYSEAPRRMHFWAGVSAIGGALRRRVWIDQFYFKWIPNFYILFVAPPGVVSKSTTADTAMEILREVPGISFGPDIITWQALVSSFANATEQFQYNGSFYAQSAITCVASELGNLLDPTNRELVDLLVTLWDNRKNLDKSTKMSGEDHIANPSTNIIGCTTPSWLQENVPQGVVGGGLASRFLFVHGDKKSKLIDLPAEYVPPGLALAKQKLLEDLIEISKLAGPFTYTPEAREWSKAWYAQLWADNAEVGEETFGNYHARKQTHLWKTAMVLAVAKRDELIITAEDLSLADTMLTDIEQDMPKVFARMGKSEGSIQATRFISYIEKRGAVPYEEAYRFMHAHFPDAKDFEGILAGAIRAGFITLEQRGEAPFLVARKKT